VNSASVLCLCRSWKVEGSRSKTLGATEKTREYILLRSSEGRARKGKVTRLSLSAAPPSSFSEA
jgi:hypothetical protein